MSKLPIHPDAPPEFASYLARCVAPDTEKLLGGVALVFGESAVLIAQVRSLEPPIDAPIEDPIAAISGYRDFLTQLVEMLEQD